MEEWKEYKLGEVSNIQTGPFGSQLHQRDYVDEGTPCIMPTNIGIHLDILSDGIAKVKSEDVNRLKKHCVKVGDIIYSRRGDIEKCAYITQKEEGWLCGTGCLRIRIESEITNPHFIAYQLCTKECKSWIVGNAIGTTMLNLNSGILKELPLLIPNKQQQDKIVSILKSLDDKIEVNRKINENLEQQAQALFKSWFVDFEPFKNGEFIESELGMIPKGWRVGAIGDYCKVRSGYAFKSSWWSNSGIPVVKIKNITDDGRLDMTDSSFVSNEHADLAKEFQTKVGDLLIAMTGATIGKFCIVHSNNKLCVNQRVGKFFLGENPLKKLPFVYYNLRRPNVFEEIVRRGQGSAQPNISGKDIETISIIYPSEEIISQFNILLYSLFEKIICNLQESRRLATLRDTLLPKLMSGEIKVNDMQLSENQ